MYRLGSELSARLSGATSGKRSESTIVRGLNGHNNALGLMRLIFAFAVIGSHAYPLGGFGMEPEVEFLGAADTIGGVAVACFFAISGY